MCKWSLLFFSISLDDLQDLVNVCSKYAKSHCIVFNASKSTGMIFFAPFSNYFLPNLYIAGNPINFNNSVKDFGVHFNQPLIDDNDIVGVI